MILKVSFRVLVASLLFIALILGIIGMATPNWYADVTQNVGFLSNIFRYFMATNDLPAANAVKAFLIIGIIFVGFAIILEMLIFFVASIKESIIAHIVSIIMISLAAISYVIACSIHGRRLMTISGGAIYADAYYSFILCVVTAVLCIEAVILYIIQWRSDY